MLMALLMRTRLLVTTFWAGSLWTVGYVAAPTFFLTLSDKVLAGTMAGSLFRVESWISMACALILMVLLAADKALQNNRKGLLLVVLAMLACTLLMQFGMHPMLAALRESAQASGGVMSAEIKARFGMLHGISSGIYLVQSLLAIVLVLKMR